MNRRRPITFDTVRQIAEQLPGTEVGTAHGSGVWLVNYWPLAGRAAVDVWLDSSVSSAARRSSF
jgi:hypothetical protein